MHRCLPEATLVGGSYWLPDESFDYDSGLLSVVVGCNRLRCGTCGDLVTYARDADDITRRYWCRCQSFEVNTTHVIHGELGLGLIHEFHTEWRCDGHPPLVLPAALDGVALPSSGPDASTVAQALASPPFVAPGVKRPGFWVARLHQLVDDAAVKASIGAAVAAALGSSDPRAVSGAIGFYFMLSSAAGASELVTQARARADWFERTDDPFDSGLSLDSGLFESIDLQLMRSRDPACLQLLEDTLLAGKNPSEIIMGVCKADPAFIARHGDRLVRNGVTDAATITISLKDASVGEVVAALKPIAGLSASERSEVLKAIEKYLPPDLRGPVAAAL